MRTVPVASVGSVPTHVAARAEAELAHLPTLADVFQWGRVQVPPRSVLDMVTQDEYTHDVVVAFDDAHFLVFDAT